MERQDSFSTQHLLRGFISTSPLASICHYVVCAEHCTGLHSQKASASSWTKSQTFCRQNTGSDFISSCNPISNVTTQTITEQSWCFLVNREEQLGRMDSSGGVQRLYTAETALLHRWEQHVYTHTVQYTRLHVHIHARNVDLVPGQLNFWWLIYTNAS